MKNKFLNIKIGVEFYDALMTKASFQNNWKAISPSFYLVTWIAELNAMKHGDPVEIFSGTISKIFQPYTGGAYAEFLDALESLGILQIDHSYQATETKDGHCKKYLVTEFGCQLIHSSNMQYLKLLKTDPATMRRNQKNISGRKVMSKSYEHPVLNYIYDGLKKIEFDYSHAEQAFRKSHWSDPQKQNVSGILCTFTDKKFKELEIQEADGRVYHELVNLKSDARFLLRYMGVPYKAVLDIRSCHPTFLSTLIISHPYTLHYLTHKADKVADLEREHHKWVSFFCDPKTDPKEVIRQACGFEDVETAKAAMNQSLNGSAEHPEYLAWIKTEFPLIFKLWRGTEVESTGNAIAKTFERPLMLHEELYDRADELGIVKIMPEHDGLGVFAEYDDTKLPSKLESLKKYLQTYSIKHFGVPIVIKTKMVVDWTSVDLFMEMEHKLEQLGKDYGKVKPKVNRLQRKYHSKHRDAKTGQEFGEALEKEFALLRRNKGVIEYWVERQKRGLC